MAVITWSYSKENGQVTLPVISDHINAVITGSYQIEKNYMLHSQLQFHDLFQLAVIT